LVKGIVHRWKDHPVREFLIANNIIDAKPKPLVQVAAVRNEVGPLKVANVIKLTGDYEEGKSSVARCYSCHQFDNLGVDFGPNLKGWGQGRSAEEIARAIIHPSAGIAHGYEAHEVTLEPNWKDRKSFWRINGIILSESDPLTIKCTGGLIQKVPSHEIHFIQPARNSLMLSAHQLGMSGKLKIASLSDKEAIFNFPGISVYKTLSSLKNTKLHASSKSSKIVSNL